MQDRNVLATMNPFALDTSLDNIKTIADAAPDDGIPSALLKKLHDKLLALQPAIPTESLAGKLITLMLAARIEVLDRAKQFDLYFTANTIYNLIKLHQEEGTLSEYIRQFFILREDILKNDAHDYFNTLSEANYLCVQVAMLLEPTLTSPLTLLLTHARTANRPDQAIWRDPITLDTNLPVDPREMFRSEDGRLQSYVAILDHAVSQLKTGAKKISHVFYSVDRYPNECVDLSQADIRHLQSRTPTFETLINYVEHLEKYDGKDFSIFDRLLSLRAALLDGDAKHQGSETNAGETAMIEVAQFAEWWNALSETPEGCAIQSKLKQIEENKLGRVIDIILDAKSRETSDISYCISIKGGMLEDVLKRESNKIAILDVDKKVMWRKTDETLTEWQAQIKDEIKATPPTSHHTCIFETFLNNVKFSQAFLDDCADDYYSLFINPSRKILWLEREEDDGYEATLFNAVSSGKQDDFIRYMLTYHLHQHSLRALTSVIRLLVKQSRYELAQLAFKANHDWQAVKRELVQEVFNAENIKINTFTISLINELRNDPAFSVTPIITKMLMADKYSDLLKVIDSCQIQIVGELAELCLDLFACNKNGKEKFAFIESLFLKNPALVMYNAAPNIFELLIRNTNCENQAYLELMLTNPNILNMRINDMNLYDYSLRCNKSKLFEALLLTNPNAFSTEILRKALDEAIKDRKYDIVNKILEARPDTPLNTKDRNIVTYFKDTYKYGSENHYYTFINILKNCTALDVVAFNSFHYLLLAPSFPELDQTLDRFMAIPHFVNLLEHSNHHLFLLAALLKKENIIDKLLTEKKVAANFLTSAESLNVCKVLLKNNQTERAITLLRQRTLLRLTTPCQPETCECCFKKIFTHAYRNNNLYLIKLLCLEPEFKITDINLVDAKKDKPEIFNFLIKQEQVPIDSKLIKKYIMTNLNEPAPDYTELSQIFKSKQKSQIAEFQDEIKQIFTSHGAAKGSNILLETILDQLPKAELFADCLVEYTDTLKKTNMALYHQVLVKYKNNYPLPQLQVYVSDLLQTNHLQLATTLIADYSSLDLLIMLCEAFNREKTYLGNIDFFVTRLKPFDDASFCLFLSRTHANNTTLISYFIKYNEGIPEGEKKLFDARQMSTMRALLKILLTQETTSNHHHTFFSPLDIMAIKNTPEQKGEKPVIKLNKD